MKNLFKLFGFAALAVAIGFSIVSCKMDSDYEMLDGRWDRGDIVVTFSGSSGVFTEISSGSAWKAFQNNGIINIGDKKFRNIKQRDDLIWTGQELCYTVGTYDTFWDDCTFIVSSSGQTLQVSTTSAGSATYTRD